MLISTPERIREERDKAEYGRVMTIAARARAAMEFVAERFMEDVPEHLEDDFLEEIRVELFK